MASIGTRARISLIALACCGTALAAPAEKKQTAPPPAGHAPLSGVWFNAKFSIDRDDVLPEELPRTRYTADGQPLPVEHGGPLRMITPQLYAWKGSKWIKRIEFMAGNRLGFWEERGYSDTAYPWRNDRYS